jgi:hypothetical protein
MVRPSELGFADGNFIVEAPIQVRFRDNFLEEEISNDALPGIGPKVIEASSAC